MTDAPRHDSLTVLTVTARAVPGATIPERTERMDGTRRLGLGSEPSACDLDAIRGDGVGFSIMVGAGETYVAAFALALGDERRGGGLVASLPLLPARSCSSPPPGVSQERARIAAGRAMRGDPGSVLLLFAVAAAPRVVSRHRRGLCARGRGPGVRDGGRPAWNRGWPSRSGAPAGPLLGRAHPRRTSRCSSGCWPAARCCTFWKPAVAALLPFAVLFLVGRRRPRLLGLVLSRQTRLGRRRSRRRLVHLLSRLSGRGTAVAGLRARDHFRCADRRALLHRRT